MVASGTTNKEDQNIKILETLNYSATGRTMGVPAWILKRGAGWAQKRAGTSKQDWRGPLGPTPHGDDPVDQKYIQRGINYYDIFK